MIRSASTATYLFEYNEMMRKEWHSLVGASFIKPSC